MAKHCSEYVRNKKKKVENEKMELHRLKMNTSAERDQYSVELISSLPGW